MGDRSNCCVWCRNSKSSCHHSQFAIINQNIQLAIPSTTVTSDIINPFTSGLLQLNILPATLQLSQGMKVSLLQQNISIQCIHQLYIS